jgi:peptide/nickel transport system permease protein
MSYLVGRLLRAIVLLVGVSMLCFLFTELAPGSFFAELRLNPQISEKTISELEAHFGADQPLRIRYLHWMKSVAHGDFGYSLAYNQPVRPLLWEGAEHTLLLTCTATLLTWLIGVPLGVWAGSARTKVLDRCLAVVSSSLLSVPEIVIALALLALAVRTRTLPVGGMMSLGYEDLSFWAKVGDLFAHMLLPVLILVLGSVSLVERHVRSSVFEVFDAPCIQAARGLGIGKARLLFRHVLPLAANPAISLFGFSLAGLLGGSLLVEVVTGWPGLGPLIVEATLARDLYVVIGAVMLSAVFLVGGNFVADLLLMALDPRIRGGETHAS